MRSLVEPCVVPPERPHPDQEGWQRQARLDFIQRGLDRRYPLLDDVHDRRIYRTTAPIENFLSIALRCTSLAELQEAIRPRYYGNMRYKPEGDYVPPIEVREVPTYLEPSTAAPGTADSSSEEEEEALQLMV